MSQEQHLVTPTEEPDRSAGTPPSSAPSARRQALEWAAHQGSDPSMAAADWMARDLEPRCAGAIALVTDPATTLDSLRSAKEIYKAMRIMGELPADRRTGARLYLAAIAAAVAFHDARISAQNDEALREALHEMGEDDAADPALRHLASLALRRLRSDGSASKRRSGGRRQP